MEFVFRIDPAHDKIFGEILLKMGKASEFKQCFFFYEHRFSDNNLLAGYFPSRDNTAGNKIIQVGILYDAPESLRAGSDYRREHYLGAVFKVFAHQQFERIAFNSHIGIRHPENISRSVRLNVGKRRYFRIEFLLLAAKDKPGIYGRVFFNHLLNKLPAGGIIGVKAEDNLVSWIVNREKSLKIGLHAVIHIAHGL